jgi:hypothetical protein
VDLSCNAKDEAPVGRFANSFLSNSEDYLLYLLQNDVRGFLADHVDRALDEQPWNAGEDRGIHDAQTCGAVYPKIAAQDASLLERTNWAST